MSITTKPVMHGCLYCKFYMMIKFPYSVHKFEITGVRILKLNAFDNDFTVFVNKAASWNLLTMSIPT